MTDPFAAILKIFPFIGNFLSAKPNIHITNGVKDPSHAHIKITNLGGDIINMKVKIFWLQDGQEQSRVLESFFDEGQDMVMTRSHFCDSLRIREAKKLASIPLYSDDGNIRCEISGVWARFGRTYQKEFLLTNNQKQNTHTT